MKPQKLRSMAPAPEGKQLRLVVKTMPIAKLLPHERNPRKHPAEGSPEWLALKASLDHDYFDPVVWNQRNGKLVSGHFRVKVAKEMSVTMVDVVVVDYDEETHLARMIAANHLLGEWDDATLKAIMDEATKCPGGAAIAGMTDAEVTAILKECSSGSPPPAGINYSPQFGVIVVCADESQQKTLYDRFQAEGLSVKVVVT